MHVETETFNQQLKYYEKTETTSLHDDWTHTWYETRRPETDA